MRSRPKELTYLAFILAGIALSFPLQIMWMFGDSPLDPAAVFCKLTPLNWTVMTLAALLSGLVLNASPWVWFVSPAFVIATVWNHWLIAEVNGGAWAWMACLATLGVLATQSLLLRPEVFRVLMHPELRWWRTPGRARVLVEAKVCPVSGGELLSRTFDLSENGAFVAIDGSAWLTNHEGSFKKITLGSYCNLRLKLTQTSSFSCTAQVVRRAEARGNYPAGFGLRFVAVGATERKVLLGFLRQVRAEAALAEARAARPVRVPAQS